MRAEIFRDSRILSHEIGRLTLQTIVIAGCGGFIRGGVADERPDADPFADPVR